jgi:hypothetical protein
MSIEIGPQFNILPVKAFPFEPEKYFRSAVQGAMSLGNLFQRISNDFPYFLLY